MRLDHIAIKGLLRFSDLVTIDCAKLPAGLVAVVGDNGSGKTTLLESPLATLYRSFPSRDSKELFDYAHDRDSFLETVFELGDGNAYRARVNIDGVRRTSEAVLERTDAAGMREILNDGKVSTFDQAIGKVFPPREVLLASAFSAQNKRGSFVTLDRKGRKDLFAQLLGLDHYEAMAQTARTAAGLVEQARVRQVAERDVLARQCGDEVAVQLADADADLLRRGQRVDEERERLRRALDETEAQLATVSDQVAAYAVATQRVQTIEREQAARQAEQARLTAARAKIETDRVADRRRLQDSRNRALADLDDRQARSARAVADDLAKVERALADTLADIDTRVRNNRGLIVRATEIRAAVERLAAIEAALATARTDEECWRQQRTATADQLRAVDLDIVAARLAQNDVRRAEQDIALLSSVPCAGEGRFGACAFLTNAGHARAALPGLQEKAAVLASLVSKQEMLATDVAAADGQLATIAQTIKDLDADKRTAAATAKLAAPLAEAEARLAELETKRTEAQDAAARGTAEARARETERATEIAAARVKADADASEAAAEAEARAAEALRQVDADLAAVATARDTLGTQLQEARVALADTEAGNQQAAQLQATLGVLRGRWDDSTRELAQLEAGRADVARQRQALADRQATLSDIEARLRTLNAELLEWQLLAKALGRDGLPNLEIDAAGPTVSAFANDLLAGCSMGRFSIELVTQEAKASGKGMKESFEIKVLDSERGGDARDLSDLSGGEQILVSEALANAIALTANRRTDRPIRTCWRDETTGPLDAENAARYVPMLRTLQELGGFDRIFFVSHNPESAAMADAQIVLHDGQADVRLPPYAA